MEEKLEAERKRLGEMAEKMEKAKAESVKQVSDAVARIHEAKLVEKRANTALQEVARQRVSSQQKESAVTEKEAAIREGQIEVQLERSKIDLHRQKLSDVEEMLQRRAAELDEMKRNLEQQSKELRQREEQVISKSHALNLQERETQSRCAKSRPKGK